MKPCLVSIALLGLAAGAAAQQDQVPCTSNGIPLPPSADLTLQAGAAPAPSALAFGGGTRAASACDDFNRPNSTNMGPDWTEVDGDFEVLNNMVHTLVNMSRMIHTSAWVPYAGSSVEFDLDGTSTSLVYAAAVLGYDPVTGEDIFVKIQNQSGLPGYDTYGFYHGNNGGGYSTWGGFRAFPSPIPGGHVRVSVDPTGDVVTLEIDTDFNGTYDFVDTAPGLITSGLSSLLGSEYGYGGFGPEFSDNWELNDGCGGAVVEIPWLTKPHSFVDMDAVGPAGPTSVAAIKAAGTGGGAAIRGITLIPNLVGQGGYNTNPNGRALGLLNGGLELVDPPTGVFDSFDASIGLNQLCTEIGVGIGDWIGSMTFEFWNGNNLVASHDSSSYSSSLQTIFFSVPDGFDRVEIYEPLGVGNWVIPELWIETPGATFLDVPDLVAGQTAVIHMSNLTPGARFRWAYSLAGGGPAPTAFGFLYLSSPYNELPAVTAGAGGTATYTGYVPLGLFGRTIWLHGFDTGSFLFSNPVVRTVG